MEREPVIQHWLVSVVRAAGLEGGEGLSVDSGTPVQAAWDLVAMATGVDVDGLADRVARHFRLPRADLESASAQAWRLVPVSVARRLHMFPLRYSDRHLTVAAADPVSLQAERELAAISGRTIHTEVAPPGPILEATERAYPDLAEELHQVPRLLREEKGGPHILVVEDDPETRLLIRVTLQSSGYRVTEVGEGAAALARLEEVDETYDLVSLDLRLPDMTGVEVLREMRARLRTATTPVIVATGADDPSVEVELFEAGADDFVLKPVDPPRFLLRVQAVLRRRGTPAPSEPM
jgi:CheY-like chemotaxis protein